jgi:hypothetical protein
MKPTTSTNKTAGKAGYIAGEKSRAINELQKISTMVIGFTSLLIGGWAIACMTSGLITSGGPVGLAMEYIKALI